MVTVICDALNTARSHGFFCRMKFASRVLIETIHMDASRPHSITVARLAVEAMLVVPPPENVRSHSDSEMKHTSVHAT